MSSEKNLEISADPQTVQADHVEDVQGLEQEKLPWQSIAAIGTLMMVYQSYLFTLTMPAAILSYINADIGPNPNFTWISVSWNLAGAVMVSVGGRLADIFGRRYFMLAAPLISCIGALIGATGQNIGQMIASGVFFGIGGGLGEMAPGAVQEFVPNRWRVQVLGFGPLIAYVFIANVPLGWRTVYWWSFSFEAVTAILVFLFYKPPSFKTKHAEDNKSKLALLKELDYFGLFLFASGLTLLLIGITWGGGAFPWKSANVICTIIIGFFLLVGLGFWVAFANLKYPIFPPRLFRDFRTLYYSLNVLWPRQSSLLFATADDIIIRGLYASMVSFGTIMGDWYTAIFVPRIPISEKWQLVTYMTIQTALVAAMASDGRNKVQAILLVLLASLVNIPNTVINWVMVSLGLEDQVDIGVSAGLISTSRLAGGAIATAIYSSIETSHYASVIPGKINEAAISSNFTGSVSALLAASVTNTAAAYNKVAGMTPLVMAAAETAVQDAYIDAFRLVFLVSIPFGCVAIVMALIAKPIAAHMKTDHRAVILENEKKNETKMIPAV